MNLSETDLAKVTYLDAKELHGRTIMLMPLWDGNKWHLWIPSPTGLFEAKPSDVSHIDYVAKQAAIESDLWIPFVDLVWQRASWPDVCPLIEQIGDDFHNFATAVAKLRHCFNARETIGNLRATSFAETECEYLIGLARGIFDLLQEMIATIWSNHVRLLDPAAEKIRKERHLPKTFSQMVLHDKCDLKTEAEIITMYNVPGSLAQQYGSIAPFFSSLRDLRDSVVHGGSALQRIFLTDRGFCFKAGGKAARLFSGWIEAHKFNDALVSMLPWIAHIVLGTISACNGLMNAFAAEIRLPAEIAPGYRVFVRGENGEAMIDLLRVARGESVWWG
jgi:hypothetical protein